MSNIAKPLSEIYTSDDINQFLDNKDATEFWLPVPVAYLKDVPDNLYFISNKGRVFSKSRGIILHQELSNVGYYRVSFIIRDPNTGLIHASNRRKISIHRLMMMTFKPVEGMENLIVNHIDGDKTNNSLDNLEWVTYEENTNHALHTHLTPISSIPSSIIPIQTAEEIGRLLGLGYSKKRSC